MSLVQTNDKLLMGVITFYYSSVYLFFCVVSALGLLSHQVPTLYFVPHARVSRLVQIQNFSAFVLKIMS
jgi:hypothetical protein